MHKGLNVGKNCIFYIIQINNMNGKNNFINKVKNKFGDNISFEKLI